VGKLAEYIEKKYGMKVRAVLNPLNVEKIGTSLTQALPNNPDRLFVLIVNLGSYDIYLAWDKLASTTHGVYVNKLGGNLILTADDDLELVGYEMWGIASGGESDVYILTLVGE
jgi:hypothetical protein